MTEEAKKKRGKTGIGRNGNLIPLNMRTKKEQRAIQSKAGKSSGEVRSMKKMMLDVLQKQAKITDETRKELQIKTGATGAEAFIASLFYSAVVLKSPQDRKILLEMIGEDKPKEEAADKDVNVTVRFEDFSGDSEEKE